MIGSGLKKLAKENGMRVSHGVAYGSFHGYTVTLSEGSEYKRMAVATRFPEGREFALESQMKQRNLQKEFWVQNLGVSAGGVQVTFMDSPGALKRIRAFADWFFPLLGQYGATGAQYCTECGEALGGSGCWKLIDGTALHMHDACAQKVMQDISTEVTQKKQANAGTSYGTGLIGALLGALLGAVVWALVLQLGYVTALVGLLIGWLADRGYRLFRGKQGKGKVVILVLAVILGVLAGTFGGYAISLAKMIGGGELPGYAYGDIPSMIGTLLSSNSDYIAATVRNIAMGLLFAFLGVFAFLRQAGKEVADTKVADLD